MKQYCVIVGTQSHWLEDGFWESSLCLAENAKTACAIAKEKSLEIIKSNSIVMAEIQQDAAQLVGLNEKFKEEYEFWVKQETSHEIAYVVLAVTDIGKEHIEEMLDNLQNYITFLYDGWLAIPFDN